MVIAKIKIKLELGLLNYVTKCDLKNATGVHISQFDEKDDLAILKSDVVELGIDKLKNLPSSLNSLKR